MNKPTMLDDRRSRLGRVSLADSERKLKRSAPAAPVRRQARRNLYAQVVHELGQRIAAGEFPEAEPCRSRATLRRSWASAATCCGRRSRPWPARGWSRSGRAAARGFARAATGTCSIPTCWAGWTRSASACRHAFDLVEFRLIVEPAASRLAALRATPAEKAGIAAACTALEACVGQPELIPSRDIAFHGSILAASHNSVLNPSGLADRVADAAPGDHHDRSPRRLRARPAAPSRADRGDRAGATPRGRRTMSRRLVVHALPGPRRPPAAAPRADARRPRSSTKLATSVTCDLRPGPGLMRRSD